jgi:hypothetical protein
VTEPQREGVVDQDAESTMTTSNGERPGIRTPGGARVRWPATAAQPAPALPPDAIGRAVDRTVGRWVAPVFGLLSRVRGARALHPNGRVYTAVIEVAPAAPMRPGRYRAMVRFSRGIGLPEPWPDALGLAVRLFDADGEGGVQDLLLTSSSPAVVRRHLVFPARGYGKAFYSSVLSVRADGRAVVVGARPIWSGPQRPLVRLAELDRAVGAELRGFELLLAQAIGVWTPLARIYLDQPVQAGDSEALRFDPYHHSGGLAPIGMLNAVRRRSYAASQAQPAKRSQPSAASQAEPA